MASLREDGHVEAWLGALGTLWLLLAQEIVLLLYIHALTAKIRALVETLVEQDTYLQDVGVGIVPLQPLEVLNGYSGGLEVLGVHVEVSHQRESPIHDGPHQVFLDTRRLLVPVSLNALFMAVLCESLDLLVEGGQHLLALPDQSTALCLEGEVPYRVEHHF